MHAMLPLLKESDFPAISRGRVETLQVNLGYLCNQSCLHCHVNAGPKRNELMEEAVVQSVLEYLKTHKIKILDLTGGAPEMNPHFRYLVKQARALGVRVIDRCNLTILEEEGYEWLGEFLSDNQVEVVASLPCYLSDNVDAQRGDGVFEKSIRALEQLNELGYGVEGAGLTLTLVYNPQGASLPPSQDALEAAYKRELQLRYGIVFNQLFTITNMPISRFGGMLLAKGLFEQYMQILKQAYSEQNLQTVMCRNLLSVDYQGYVYDCDFNQMLNLPLLATSSPRPHLRELTELSFAGQPIAVGDHCFGCTAGQGSSCGGALG
mgnify:CR=1 FL=1